MKHLTTTLSLFAAALTMAPTLLAAQHRQLKDDAERGDSSVSWILIILAVVAIATIVVAAVTAYVQGKVGELG